MGAKPGRKQKPYHTSWGEIVPGLSRQGNDGRWRIVATGVRYSEADERRAVERFKAITSCEPVEIPVAVAKGIADIDLSRATEQEIIVEVGTGDDDHITISRSVPGEEVWKWLRDQLANRPEYVARMTGIPELAGLRHLSIPKHPLRIQAIIDNYETNNPSTRKAKHEATEPLRRLMKRSGAITLDDLTTEKLLEWRRHIETTVPGPATRRAYYSRVKSVIAFGMRMGMEASLIRPALDRCKVLWTGEALPTVTPRPISKENFQSLLDAGGDAWRPWLLAGLNLCLHMEEVCALRWEYFDLDRGTYACIRNKTRAKRIPRAATLWPETVAAMSAIKRVGPYVFTSGHGTRYNKNTRVNDFRELRVKAGLPNTVTFDTLRDGAYTAASHGTTDGRLARLLAGHKSPGLEDNYVLRNPEIVRPACDAVYRSYFDK